MAGDEGNLRSAQPEWLRQLKAVVFDKDGTLIDLNARWAPFFRSAFSVVADGDDALMTAFETKLGVEGDRLVPNGPAAISSPSEILGHADAVMADAGWEQPDERHAALTRGIESATMGHLVALGDVAGTFASLAERGLMLAVATSDGRDNTSAELVELGIDGYVSALACGDDGVVKPDPAVLLGIAAELDLTPDRMVFVGDSTQDRLTAERADIRFIEVRADEGIGSEWWVRTIAEIADAFAG